MRAIITGSSNGLGLAIAKHFAEHGIHVAVSARKEDRLKQILKEIREVGKDVEVIGGIVDFGNKKSVEAYVKLVHIKWGKIDVLVNNAGIFREDTVSDDMEENLLFNLNVNLLSSVRMNHAIQNGINDGPGSFIFNIVSIAAKSPRHDAASYSISKMALRTFTDLQRESLRERNIKVIGVYPGAMNTNSWDEEDVERKNMIQTTDICSSLMNIMSMTNNAGVEEIIINPVKPI